MCVGTIMPLQLHLQYQILAITLTQKSIFLHSKCVKLHTQTQLQKKVKRKTSHTKSILYTEKGDMEDCE